MSVVLGLVSEAFVRSMKSYKQSLSAYTNRIEANTQPSTTYIDLFNINHQLVVLIVSNLVYLVVTLVLYVHMRSRAKGYQLRWLLLTYDAINVCLAAYIAISTLRYKASHGGGMLLCNPISYEMEAMAIVPVFLLFYMQKIFEFFDTWLFILRKSAKQVSFLHLFHHSSITIVVGFLLPFDYNGDMYLPIMLNSFNHMAVYLHYLLATLGIRSPWAGYITLMQLTQFVLIFFQNLIAYKVGPTCGSPDFAKVLMIVYMGSMVALFVRYLVQRYILGHHHSTLDVCGVIKTPRPSESSLLAKTVQHCGTARLNDRGECHIALPDSFPDPSLQVHPVTSTKRFTFVYHLTPLNEAMPNLYVSGEVRRWDPSSDAAVNGRKNNGLQDTAKATSSKSYSADNLSGFAAGKPIMTLSTGGAAIAKSQSFTNFATIRHNDRIIDGPLPVTSLKQVLTDLKSSLLPAAPSLKNTVELQEASVHTSDGTGNMSTKRPLCFSIAGGASRGRVSWMVMIVPGEESDEDASRIADDWRAIQ